MRYHSQLCEWKKRWLIKVNLHYIKMCIKVGSISFLHFQRSRAIVEIEIEFSVSFLTNCRRNVTSVRSCPPHKLRLGSLVSQFRERILVNFMLQNYILVKLIALFTILIKKLFFFHHWNRRVASFSIPSSANDLHDMFRQLKVMQRVIKVKQKKKSYHEKRLKFLFMDAEVLSTSAKSNSRDSPGISI